MGAWGTGSFENDSAQDWVSDVTSLSDVTAKFDTLASLEEQDIDVDLASEIIAAAEIVAISMDQVAPDIPGDLLKKLDKLEEADAALIEQAKMAVSEVLGDSELLDLWSEDSEDSAGWNLAITGLIARLNSDVAANPPSPAEIKEVSGGFGPCVFCSKDIDPKDLTSLSIRDMSSKDNMAMSYGVYCHLSCLNGKLHPRHLIQNWKFNVDEALVDQILKGPAD
ncbi:DUF4259 domain-containing protein [Sphingorhabdus sp. Alg231-15]|uniref:DUF4259 domain-containing protein n=1 Tax=Sphingorhabdus sp. Alg231-15 TaxID=1922222 RepID=UPI000D560956